uniref:AAA_12 domain-containing protein n=1 Tax=Parastrongyloides trichosuri TaxID=131310 RepID=A0A0N4ZWJ6_PARTI
MASRYPVTIIKASAGTGKIQVLASAALSTINERQLIVCNTNSAPEAVVARLRKWCTEDEKVIRLKSTLASIRYPDLHRCGEEYWYNNIIPANIGSLGASDREIFKSYLEYKARFKDLVNCEKRDDLEHKFFDRLERVARKLDTCRKKLARIIMDVLFCPIYVTTIDYAVLYLRQKFPTIGFRKIFFDEGSQVRLSDILVILSLFPGTSFSVLGVSKQLPPYVDLEMNLTAEEKVLAKNSMCGLRNEMYTKRMTLNLNFRSHPEVVALVFKIFYGEKLEAFLEQNDLDIAISGMYFILKRVIITPVFTIYPFYFLNIKCPSSKHLTGSIYNEGEAKMVASYCMRILKTCSRPKSIGIVSFYKAQINTLRKAVCAELEILENKTYICNTRMINEAEFKASNFCCTIDTVDAFQEEERDIILIVTSRSSVR